MQILPGVLYPAYRLLIIAVGLVLALALYLFIAHTRTGMLVRAGSSNRDMARLMGARVERLFAIIFMLGAMLSAVAGALLGPLLAAVLVGIVDTSGRAFLPDVLNHFLAGAVAAQLGPALAAIAIYVLMAAVLFLRPQGLFPARA